MVRLTQVQGDQVMTIRLCERCAAERGVDTALGTGAGPLLAAFDNVGAVVGPPAVGDANVCPGCGATFEEFRTYGRLGCPACWDAFSGALGPLVRRLHGATHHTGIPYLPPGIPDGDSAALRERLERQLERAIATENFEHAAELRDQLRGLTDA